MPSGTDVRLLLRATTRLRVGMLANAAGNSVKSLLLTTKVWSMLNSSMLAGNAPTFMPEMSR